MWQSAVAPLISQLVQRNYAPYVRPDAFGGRSPAAPPSYTPDFNQVFGSFNTPDPTPPQKKQQQSPVGNQGPPRPDYGPGSNFPLQNFPTGPDSTAMYAGSPETNPMLKPMGSGGGSSAPWSGSPFSGMLDQISSWGQSPNAGLVPRFVNLMGKFGNNGGPASGGMPSLGGGGMPSMPSLGGGAAPASAVGGDLGGIGGGASLGGSAVGGAEAAAGEGAASGLGGLGALFALLA